MILFIGTYQGCDTVHKRAIRWQGRAESVAKERNCKDETNAKHYFVVGLALERRPDLLLNGLVKGEAMMDAL
jgi:hypothetical protein